MTLTKTIKLIIVPSTEPIALGALEYSIFFLYKAVRPALLLCVVGHWANVNAQFAAKTLTWYRHVEYHTSFQGEWSKCRRKPSLSFGIDWSTYLEAVGHISIIYFGWKNCILVFSIFHTSETPTLCENKSHPSLKWNGDNVTDTETPVSEKVSVQFYAQNM